jgi:hypothetical protein
MHQLTETRGRLPAPHRAAVASTPTPPPTAPEWRRKYSGAAASDVLKRQGALDAGNPRLKCMYAHLALENAAESLSRLLTSSSCRSWLEFRRGATSQVPPRSSRVDRLMRDLQESQVVERECNRRRAEPRLPRHHSRNRQAARHSSVWQPACMLSWRWPVPKGSPAVGAVEWPLVESL